MVVVVAAPWRPRSTAAGPGGTRAEADEGLAAPSLSLDRTAALAVDVPTGAVVFAHNESLPVAPASNEKVPVSWTALTRLGAGYRFHTEVFGVGARAARRWDGDLVLKGYGDPTLSDGRPRSARGDDPRARDPHGDRTGPRRRVVLRREARRRGLEARTSSAARLRRCRRSSSTGRRAGRRSRRRCSQPGRSGTRSSAAASRSPDARASASHRRRRHRSRPTSPIPLASIVRRMNHESDNFYAEMLLKQLVARDGQGRDVGRRRQARRRDDARRRDPGRRRADRRRLRALEPRPPDGGRARRRAPGRCDRPARSGAAFVGSLAVAGTSGTLSTGCRPPRRREGQDGHDEPRLHAVGPDPRHVGVRRAGERRARSRPGPPARLRIGSSRSSRLRLKATLSECRSRQADELQPCATASGEQGTRSASARIGTPAFSAFAAFDPGLSPTITPGRLLRDGVRDLRAERLERGLRLLAGVPLERAGDHVLPARSAAPRRAGPPRPPRTAARARAAPSTSARFSSSANHSAISSARSGPIPSASSISSWRRGHQRVDGAEVPGEVPCQHPADLRHVEAEQHARERLLLRALDRVDRAVGRDLAVALDLEQLLRREPVEVGHRPQQPLVPELAHELLADALDVHRRA